MMLSLSSSNTGTERKRPAAMSARICRPDRDLLVLARVGQGEADAQGVADAAREELLEGHARLDDRPPAGCRPRSRPGAAARRGAAAAKRVLASMTLRGCESLRLTT